MNPDLKRLGKQCGESRITEWKQRRREGFRGEGDEERQKKIRLQEGLKREERQIMRERGVRDGQSVTELCNCTVKLGKGINDIDTIMLYDTCILLMFFP